MERTTPVVMKRTAPMPRKVPVLPRMTVGRPWGVFCSRCEQELRGGSKPERKCEYVCSMCLSVGADSPKVQEEADRLYRAATQKIKLAQKGKGDGKKKRTRYGGEKVVERSKRLRAERENPTKMRRTK